MHANGEAGSRTPRTSFWVAGHNGAVTGFRQKQSLGRGAFFRSLHAACPGGGTVMDTRIPGASWGLGLGLGGSMCPAFYRMVKTRTLRQDHCPFRLSSWRMSVGSVL